MKKLWSDLKVSTKLMVLVIMTCIALIAVGIMGLNGMHEGNRKLNEAKMNIDHVVQLGEMKNLFLTMRLDLVYMMSLKDEAKLKAKWEDFAAKSVMVRGELKKFVANGVNELEETPIRFFREGFENYVLNGAKLGEMLLKAHSANDAESIESAIAFATGTVAPLYNKPAEQVNALVNEHVQEAQDMFTAATASFKKSFLIMGILIGVVLVSSVCLGLYIAGSVINPLKTVIKSVQRLAGGDFSVSCDVSSRDELGLLAEELNQMSDKLQTTISMATHNGNEVAITADKLHSTSAQFATSAEQTAAQTQTIATASEEMAATSSDIANNCLLAATNAARMNEDALNGARIADDTISVMEQISLRVQETAAMVGTLGSRSEEIGEIVGTIEDIADQTNLLALNAAIEAARAGEQGRGFAVVADEVRALAERTTKATKQIAETIKNIQRETKNTVIAMESGVMEVERGKEQTARSGQALRNIMEQVSELTMQVNQISTAAEEQTATTSEITNNIQQITEVVQLNANGSHESAAAATQLAHLSDELRVLMAQFKLAA